MSVARRALPWPMPQRVETALFETQELADAPHRQVDTSAIRSCHLENGMSIGVQPAGQRDKLSEVLQGPVPEIPRVKSTTGHGIGHGFSHRNAEPEAGAGIDLGTHSDRSTVTFDNPFA
jgi:hypothetical protein